MLKITKLSEQEVINAVQYCYAGLETDRPGLNPNLPLSSYVTVGLLLHLSEPQFLHPAEQGW